MSTKTSFKRIAAVAAVALTLGGFSAVSASAATTEVAGTYTASLAINTPSITVVGALVTNHNTYSAGIFKITATNNQGNNAGLYSGETITADVVGVPTNVDSTYSTASNAGDLLIQPLSGTGYGASFANTGTASTDGLNARITSTSTASADEASLAAGITPTSNGVYFLGISPAKSSAVDHGYYTVRIRLTDSTGFITQQTVKVQFVTSAADAGAVITPVITGSFFAGDSFAYTSSRKVTATLRDGNGGLIQSVGSAAYAPVAPTLSAASVDGTTAAATALTIADSGATGVDRLDLTTANAASTTVGTGAAVTLSDQNAAAALLAAGDGTYGITSGALVANTTDGQTLRVRYGSVSSSVALTLGSTTSSGTLSTTSVTAAGNVATSTGAIIPLADATITAKILLGTTSAPVTGAAVYYNLAYTGCVAADLSPTASATATTATKVYTDASGIASVAITNANPQNGCSAVIKWSSSANLASATTQTYSWQKSLVAKALPSSGDITAVLGATTKVTWTILDQFSSIMVGKVVTFTETGANVPTTGLKSATTDANGQVSFSWTDALNVATGADTIAIATVDGNAPASAGTVKVTYAATMPVVASLKAQYATGPATYVLVPTTAIGGVTGVAVSTADQLDTTKSLTQSTATYAAPWVQLKFTALTSALATVNGVPTTVTVTGAQLVGSNGLLATSVVVYSNDSVYVLGTKTGVATVTATNGTLSAKATINFVNTPNQDERVVSVTEKSGVATILVVDAFGNPVSGASVDVTTDSGALLGSGATFGNYQTAVDGTVSINVSGAGNVTAKLHAVSAAKYSYLAGYGDATGTVVTTGAPAGVRSATIATLGVGTAALDAAQAAQDAANEATDAANAATDAANNAMDSADAAQQAAMDAGDKADAALAAVTDLATKVSEIASQISALSAVVSKIAAAVAKISAKVKA